MAETLHISLTQPHITEVAGLPITPTLLTTWLVIAILLMAAFFIGRNVKLVPGRGQVVLEGLFTTVYDYIRDTLESEKLARIFFPLLMSMFIFILVANLFGLFPFMESIGLESESHSEHSFVPLLYPMNADLNIPLALAIVSFVTIEISGILYLGFLKYGKKFVNLRSPIDFAIGLLEIIGNLARLVSLSFRLFGNILAGHLLILVIMFFIPFVAPLPFMFFEVFVGFMQAAIFALLTLFFIKLSIAEPHGEAEAH